MPKPPVLFWRAKSAATVLGAAMTERGTPDYTTKDCYFGDAAYTNNAANNYINTVSFSPNAYTIEAWVNTDLAVSGGASTGYKFFFGYRNGAEWGGVGFYPAPYYFYCAFNAGTFDYRGNAGTWSAGDIVHMAFVFDRTGIDGSGDYCRIYKDNVDIWSSASAPSASGNTSFDISLGTYNIGGSYGEPFQGAFENVKLYDYAKVDFSDRLAERGGLNDSAMLL